MGSAHIGQGSLLIGANDNDLWPLLLTVKQTCSLLAISKSTVFVMLADGSLERRRLGGATRVTLRSVLALADV